MIHKKLLLLGALALVAFAAGCSSDECSVNADCASKGSNFVCANSQCVQKTPVDGGTTCSPACGGSTPICNQSTLTCVQCTQNSECSGATPACDVATNTCVACTSNAQCGGSTPACDTGSHTCVECAAAADCNGNANGNACDSATHTCVACTGNSDCTDASAPVCDTSTHACVGCVDSTNCDSTPSTPVCDTGNQVCVGCLQTSDCGSGKVCDTANKACVECLGNGDCAGSANGPVCNTTSHTCTNTCASDTDCAPTPATPACDTVSHTCAACAAGTTTTACTGSTPACDTSTDTCVACVDNSTCTAPNGVCANHTCVQCAVQSDCSGTPSTPSCDTTNHTCVASCAAQTDCTISQDCNTSAPQGSLCVDVDVAAASTAITSVKTTTPASPVTIAGAIVTYLKPSVSGDQAGFFVQAEASGPALFVADPGTLNPVPAVGDRVSFAVTSTTAVGSLTTATIDTASWQVISSGHDASLLKTDVSAATDLVSALGDYDSRLIGLTFSVASTPSNANTGYMQAQITTTGITTASNSLKLYAPSSVFTDLEIQSGCQGQITNGVMWRFNAAAEPAVWKDNHLTLTSCPFNLLSAVPSDATHVVLTFNRTISTGTTLQASDFTVADTTNVANNVTISAVAVSGNTVTLTTTAQTANDAYTITAGSNVTDGLGDALTTASANFSGFVTPAQVVINELNANIANGCDLIELRVISSGTMASFKLQERDTGTLVTFPAGFSVLKNDIIVVHMNSGVVGCNSNGATTETTSKNQLPNATYPENYDTAWDVWSTDSGLTNTDNVFTLYDALGNIMDAVLASDDPTGTAAAGSETQAAAVASANQWQMVGGGVPVGGFVDDNFNAWAAQDLNATATGVTDPAGTTIQRNTDTDNNDKDDWVMAPQSWGIPNAGQNPL